MNTVTKIIHSIHHQPWAWRHTGYNFIHVTGLIITPRLFDADPPVRFMATRWERFKLWWAITWQWRDFRANFKFIPSRLTRAMRKMKQEIKQ